MDGVRSEDDAISGRRSVTEPVGRLTTALAGRYKIEREVGKGGMATVYLAHDLKHDRRVAVKILRPELAAVVGAERFLHEIKVTANLHHPSIVPLFDSGEAGEFVYYVMPYLEGQSLRDRLNQERQLSIDEAIAITQDAAAALDYAHRQGVVHRDVKPENIALHEGRAQVLDFGIALAVTTAGGERLTETGLSLGTPSYMSPEQATGDRRIDARSDVYSLGCVLYEMLAGDPPFSGSNVRAVIARVVTETPPSVRIGRDTIPEHIESAVMKALAKVAADRFTTAGEFAAALTTGQPAPPRRAPIRFSREHALTTAIVAVVAAVAIVTGILVVGGDGARRLPVFADHQQVTTLPGIEDFPSWSPDGRTIVYSADADGYLGLWTRQVGGGQAHRIGLAGVDEAQAAFSPDGERIAFVSTRNRGGRLGIFSGSRAVGFYTPGRNGDLFVMPAFGGTAVRVADDAYDPSWSPDGTRLAFRSPRDGSWRLYTVPVDGRQVDLVEGAEPQVLGAAWSPDGEWIAYVAGGVATGWDMYVVPANGGDPVQMTFDSASAALRPSWSPDGTWIAYSSNRGGSLNLWGVPFESGAAGPAGPPEPLTTGIGEDVNVSVGLGGRALVYATLRTAANIWKLNAAGDSLERITFETTTEDYPRVSPDGSRMLFYSDRSGGDEVWMLDLSTNEPTQVSRGGGTQSAWSPDGRLVAYGTRQGLAILDLETGGITTIAEHFTTSSPVFSPDGREVAFHGLDQRRRELLYSPLRRSQLYRAPVDGSRAHQVIPTPEGDPANPSWAGDGRSVYFELDEVRAVSIWVVDLATSQYSQVATGGSDDAHPAVSSDGTELLFLRNHRDLYVMRLPDGTPRLIRSFDEPNRLIEFPSWTPDGGVTFSIADKSGDLFLLRAPGQG